VHLSVLHQSATAVGSVVVGEKITSATGAMATGHKIVVPKAVVGSRDPTIPTPEMRDTFEPQLRAKEALERRTDVKVMFTVFAGYHVLGAAWGVASSASLAALLFSGVCLVAALFGSDLFTGLLHIYLDHRRCDLGDPIDMVAYAFRYDHHAHPTNFLKHSPFFPAGSGETVLKVSGPISLVAHTLLWAAYRFTSVGSVVRWELPFLVICTWMASGTCCQATHALAHEGIGGSRNKSLPGLVAFLQRSGLILSPRVHAAHHKGKHDRNFCIFNGWANPLLNLACPAIFWAMRRLPGHFDELAVPAPPKPSAGKPHVRPPRPLAAAAGG